MTLRIAATVLLGAVYAPTLVLLNEAWRTNSYAGHGMLVPFFSGLLLWGERARLRQAVGPPTWAGVPLLGAGLALLALGTWLDSLFLAGVSFAVSAGGLVWCLFGPNLAREARFPIGFLALWVPLPDGVVSLVTDRVQELAAVVAAALVSGIGIPVYQRGTLLHLTNASLEVVEGCNGLRFMMALLVLAVAYAHVGQQSRFRQVLLVGAAIPLALVANWVRIAVITVAAHYYGSEAAEGLMHHSIGKSIWAVALIGLGLFGFMLRGRSRKTKGPAEPSTAHTEDRATPAGRQPQAARRQDDGEEP